MVIFMFIKSSIRKKANGKEYKTHYLVEGYRDPKTGKVKHKYISNISSLPDHSILSLQKSLRNQSGEVDRLDLSELEVLCTKEYGNIRLFQKLYAEYFGKYFTKAHYNRAIEAIVINKIFAPRSKRALKNWLSRVDMGYKITNKNDLYESLDYLEEEQSKIERRLSKLLKKNGCNILLYDITSTYFEGKGAENICKHGYSRDHRRDRLQVNIGLITSCDGTPISVEIIAGNISDKQTLEDQIKKVRDKFNIKEITFVFDRGMKSVINLKNLTEAGYSYITALSHAELKKQCESNKEIQMSLLDKRDLAKFKIGDKNYSLVHNPIKAEKDKKARNCLIEKTQEKLDKIKALKRKYTKLSLQDKVSKVINKYKCEKYITYSFEEYEEDGKIFAKLNHHSDTKAIDLATKYDGFYMIESSNKKIEGKDSVSQYKDLQLVERAFDTVKNHIEIRPVFHYKDTRIKGHIMSSFMSYFLLHKFKQKCQNLLRKYSLDDLLTELTHLNKTYFKIKHFCFEKITKVSDLSRDILNRFNINLLSRPVA